ncbi:MAG: proton-conducting membrane transporter [Tessaracoccus sp.]|uniref:NADH-quinone oxidoreductase subunit B n=1 Tax=Tessaracoccus sp. TaxID=1971211 RepID=UPI001ECF0C19|nr:proton-conducting membrane transporter [Tessaracoccus sp.]MBK7821875.1 proton-conducting membrane transporter [Tessaracoccus sp.]
MLRARDWFDDGSVFVVDIPLACCALETEAAAEGRGERDARDIPADARVVVTLSGTLTTPALPAVRHALDGLGRPAVVVAFGACACVGGPYWDSYAVVNGAESLVAVDHFIAGCPPPPSALDDLLATVRTEAVSA